MDIGDRTARLVVDVEARYLGFKGLRELLSLWNRPTESARKFAVEQAALSRSMTKSLSDAQRAEASLAAGTQSRIAKERASKLRLAAADRDLLQLQDRRMKMNNADLKRTESLLKRKMAAAITYKDTYLRSTAEIAAADKRLAELQTKIAENQIAQNRAVSRARRAAFRASAVGIADRAAGLGVGAAGLGLVAGGWALSRAAGWKGYVAQQLSNSPLPGNQGNAFPRWALNMAGQTGASPKDIMLSLRYSSERLSTPGRPNTGRIRNYQRYANMLGLPTGGSESVPGIMQGMTAVAKNFPQWANQPGAIARMLLSAGQRMPGTTIPEFVQSIPNLLVMAGHIHRKDALPQMLGLASTLGQAGYNTGEMETQLKNLFAKVIKPSAGTTKFVDWVKKTQGIDLSGDFSMEGLQKMGIKGWLADLHSKLPMNADRAKVLSRLFPNMRGFFGALALTGNLYGPAQQNTADIMRAPGTAGTREDALARNYRRYLGLTSTQAARLQQNFNRLVITMGTALIPAGNRLIKVLIPLAKNADTWTKHNQKLLVQIVNILPKVLLLALALKGLLIIRSLVTPVKLLFSIFKGGFNVITGINTKMSSLLTRLKDFKGAIKGLGTVAEDAAGVASAGTGIAGLGSKILKLGGAATEMIAPMVALEVLFRAIAQNGLDPKKWASFFANRAWDYMTSPLAALLKDVGISSLFPKIPGVTQTVAPPWGGSSGGSGPRQGTSVVSLKNTHAPKGWMAPYGLFGMTRPAGGIPKNWGPNSGRLNANWADSWFGGNDPTNMRHWAPPPGGIAFHWDLGTAGAHLPYKLPGGKGTTYKLIGLVRNPVGAGGTGGNGWVETWQGPNGAVFTVDELSEIPGPKQMPKTGGLKLGARLHGGQYAGRTTDHLHVSGNQQAENLFYYLTNPRRRAAASTNKAARAGGAKGGPGGMPASVARWWHLITKWSKIRKLDPYKVASIIWSESGGDPNITNGDLAYGLMQIYYTNIGGHPKHPGTGVEGITMSNWMHPEQNIKTGTAILAGAITRANGNWHDALGYYAGSSKNSADSITNYRGSGLTYSQYTTGNANTWEKAAGNSKWWQRGKGSSGGPGGSGGGHHHPHKTVTDKGFGDKNTRPTTPAEWESWYSASSSNIEQAMQQAGYLTTPLNKLSPAQRATFKRLILRDINKRHGARIAHIKATVPPGELRTELIKEADSDYAQSKSHPFRFAHHYLDSAVSKRNRRTKWEQHLAGTIFSERGGLRELESSWTGINVRSLPKHGKGMYTQDNWLRYQIKRHALERQVADNTAKLYAAVHHEPKGWLPKILAQNKQTEKNADKRSKEYLRRIHKKSGAGSDIMPVQVVGQCAEYRAQNEYHKKHVKHGKSIADSSRGTETHTGNISRKMDTLISINREIAKGHKRAARGGGKLAARNHASSDPHLSGGTFHHDVMMT